MATHPISRRRFAQLVGAGAFVAAGNPALSLARAPEVKPAVADELVRLGSNENPFGPSRRALQAITDSFPSACRYPYPYVEQLVEILAEKHSVPREQIQIGAGSSEILMLCAAAFCGSNERTVVTAEPTFELLAKHAGSHGARVVQVPLTSTYAHDLGRMAAAAKPGLIYICNPNNPTASLTPKGALRDFIADVPRETMILVDEAYHEYVESTDYESVIPLVQQHPNLLVARTFSKIYGMAGIRCGYCVAQPGALKPMQPYKSMHTVSVPAAAAAMASLRDEAEVDRNRELNRRTRAMSLAELEKMGFSAIPSEANFVMIDIKRDVQPVIKGLRERKVVVGRLFPALPTHLRVTIGKAPEMQAFLTAFRAVLA